MNPKLLIIRLLLDHSLWSEYRQFIKTNDDRHLATLYTVLDDLMGTHNRSISQDEFKAAVGLLISTERDKDKEVYNQYVDTLFNADVGNDIIQDLLIKIKHREIADKLATVSFEFMEGHRTLEDITHIYEQFGEAKDQFEETKFVTDDIDEIYNQTVTKPGLRWRLGTLNRMLGSLRKGDFGFIFARPETGKTTFLASEISYFAGQAESPILWFNNEEQGQKVMTRCYQAALGVTRDEIMGDRTNAKKQYLEITKGNIRIIDDPAIYRRQVEDFCKRYRPSMVVIDQLDKIKGFDGDREDLKFGAIYQWAREIAKTYCPVIGITQANGTGEGVKWLTMNHVSGATTSKQAEADFIIGIGKTNDTGMEYIRHINISKNKLTGDTDTDPRLRHGRADVRIDPEIARYKDIGT